MQMSTSDGGAIRLRASHFVGSVWAIWIGIASETVGYAMTGTAPELTGVAGAIGFVAKVPAIILSVARGVLENATKHRESSH